MNILELLSRQVQPQGYLQGMDHEEGYVRPELPEPQMAGPGPAMFTGPQQNPQLAEQENRRLTDFVNGSVAEGGQIRKKQDYEEHGVFLENALKGFLAGASPTGEMPTREEFDRRFRQNNSPAREMLADFFTGFSDALAGKQFRSHREKAWQQEREVVAERQRAQQLKQQASMQMAQMVQREIESRRESALQGDIALMKNTLDQHGQELRKADILSRYQMQGAQLDQRVKEFEAKQVKDAKDTELKQWESLDTGNPLYDAARRRVSSQLRAAGEDVTDPNVQNKMWAQTGQEWERMERVKAQLRPQSAGREPLPIVHKMLNSDGTESIVLLDRREGTVLGGTNVGRKITDKIITSVNDLRTSSMALRSAMQIAQNTDDVVGSLMQHAPDDLRAKLGSLTGTERAIKGRIVESVSQWIVSKTGAAMTEKEREWYMSAVPKMFEKPEDFFVGMSSFLTMIDSRMLQAQYGLNVDLTPALVDVIDNTKRHIKKYGSARNLPIPSPEEMLYHAAKKQGKLIRKNAFGALEVINDAK